INIQAPPPGCTMHVTLKFPAGGPVMPGGSTVDCALYDYPGGNVRKYEPVRPPTVTSGYWNCNFDLSSVVPAIPSGTKFTLKACTPNCTNPIIYTGECIMI